MPKINLKRFSLEWKATHPKPKKQKTIISSELKDLLNLMLIKGRMGCFQDIDPRELGANYDLIPIPADNTEESRYWGI